jgi:hypothetical protein
MQDSIHELFNCILGSFNASRKRKRRPGVDRRFFHFAKLGVILGLVYRD